MARATKGQWKERYFKENFCVSVYIGLLNQLEAEAAILQRFVTALEDGETKRKFQLLADRLTLLTAQASGRESNFDLATVAMPEDVGAKIPDPRTPPKH